MARLQYLISTLLTLCCLSGFFGLGRLLFFGKDSLTWAAIGLSLFFGWAARAAIVRMPIHAEAQIRLATAPKWGDISRWRRYLMWWFDWPLYDAIREREAREMFAGPSVAVEFDDSRITVKPLNEMHQSRYYLKWVAARLSSDYPVNYRYIGLIASIVTGRHVVLEWRNPDRRAWTHFSQAVGNRSAVSPHLLAEKLEAGYLSTLSDKEMREYWQAFR